MPAPGWEERERTRERAAKAARQLRPRRRPKRFRDDDQFATPQAGNTVPSPAGQAGPELPSDQLSPVGERVLANTMRQVLASMPPQTSEQVADLEQHGRELILKREQAGEVFADPGEPQD
jgi:hypothetical protein